ncbi:MAG: class I SAM-dependent methyltransferase [Candidatus Neomarinimicrobiota bacterium]
MIKHFRDLLDDRIRIKNFRQALQTLIKPDSVVVEIGSALGTYSFFAAQAGAKAVYAIEMSDIFFVGRELARRNNLADRINFIHGKSTDIDLPERADFIILEDFSPFFFYQNLSEVIHDARQRFLKPGGSFIPGRLILHVAAFECPEWHNELNLWANESDNLFGLDWSHTTEIAFNQTYYADYRPKKLLTKPLPIKTIDLAHDSDFPFQLQTELPVTHSGLIHGLIGWWDCWFSNQQYFSNSPEAGNNSWGQLIFPFRYPVSVSTGDQIKITLMVLESRLTKFIDYKWGIENLSGQQEQDTFSGRFFDLRQFDKIRRDAIPNLNTSGLINRALLNQIDGQLSWDKIAEKICSIYPEKFPGKEDVFKLILPINTYLSGEEK